MPTSYQKQIDKVLRKFYQHCCGVNDYGCTGCKKFAGEICFILVTSKKKLLDEVEKIMRNTLSVESLRAHKEIAKMYKKLDKLR